MSVGNYITKETTTVHEKNDNVISNENDNERLSNADLFLVNKVYTNDL